MMIFNNQIVITYYVALSKEIYYYCIAYVNKALFGQTIHIDRRSSLSISNEHSFQKM